ncbi:hypothetical protein [Streptomyces coerulescens]|uniref:Uncharacterized protein n=1 Tax=Streptomyces coerulescens TaxID=29304 RepID=A0ABW0CN59_STRCD
MNCKLLLVAVALTAVMSHSHVDWVRVTARAALISILLWALLFWGQW